MRYALFLVAITLWGQSPRPVRPLVPGGRFVALVPNSAATNNYANFLWVLDTATGEVVAYRFAEMKDKDGKFLRWVKIRLANATETMQDQE